MLPGVVVIENTATSCAESGHQCARERVSNAIEWLPGQGRALSHGGDRGDHRRADTRIYAGEKRDENPGGERDDDRPWLEDKTGVRKREADSVEELEETPGEQEPEEEANDGGDHPDDEAFDDDRPEHLAIRGAQSPQRGELPRPLGDRDRERVRDHERPHEERDAAEGKQEALEEGDELAGLLRVGLGLLFPGPHERTRRQDLLDLAYQHRVGNVRLGGDGDLVDPAHLLEQPLSGWEVEACKRGTADGEPRVELDDAGDAEALDGTFGLHADGFPHLEVLVRGRFLVDDHLVRAGPIAVDEGQRVEDGVSVCDREAEIRRAAGHDGLSVISDQLRRVGIDVALGLGHARKRPDLSDQPLVQRRLRHAAAVAQIECGLSADHRVRALAYVREDAVERLVDRIGQDVGAADHRDAEHDRDGGQRRPQLAAEETPDREARHS